MKNIEVIPYIGLYGVYVLILNEHGLMSGFKRKEGWQKSTEFPYWDNWAWTHFVWGALGSIFNLNTPAMVTLAFANEFIYEPYRCKKYGEGDKSIYYAQYCDSLGHKVADFIYTLAGYGLMNYFYRDLGSDDNLASKHL
jgi:hypothetical protein